MGAADDPVAAVDAAWSRIERWLAAYAPVTARSLNPPTDPAELAASTSVVGPLPADLLASWSRHDGVDGDAVAAFTLGSWRPSTVRRSRQARAGNLEVATGLRADDDAPFWSPTWLVVAEPTWAGALFVDLAAPEDGVRAWDPEQYFAPTRVAASWADLLSTTADRLESARTHAEVPDLRSGRLVWFRADPPPGRARPVVADPPPRDPHRSVADDAPPDRVGHRRAIGRGPDWVVERDLLLLAFARGVGTPEVLRRCGADPWTAIEGDDRGAGGWQASGHRPVVRAAEVTGWGLAVSREPPGGVLIERVRALSVGTVAVGFGVDHLAATAVVAEHGEVGLTVRTGPWGVETVGDLDGYAPLMHEVGLLPSVAGTAIDDLEVAMLDLVLRLGPGTFDPVVLDEPLLGAPILPLLADPTPTQPPAVGVALDPDLAVPLAFAPEPVLRRVAAGLLHERAHELGIADDPLLLTEVDRAAGLAAPLGPLPQDTPVALALRQIDAERAAAHARWTVDRADPGQVSAWNAVAQWGGVLHRLLVRTAGESLALAAPWYDHGEPRQRLLAALGPVASPPDAVALLTAAEQARQRPLAPWPEPTFRRPAR